MNAETIRSQATIKFLRTAGVDIPKKRLAVMLTGRSKPPQQETGTHLSPLLETIPLLICPRQMSEPYSQLNSRLPEIGEKHLPHYRNAQKVDQEQILTA